MQAKNNTKSSGVIYADFLFCSSTLGMDMYININMFSLIDRLQKIMKSESNPKNVPTTPANGAGFDGFFGWVLIQVLLDEWKQVTL